MGKKLTRFCLRNYRKKGAATVQFFYNEQLYIYGGVQEYNRLGDMWRFDFSVKEWHKIKYKGKYIPEIRSGNTFQLYKNHFILIFGGIKALTYEFNDFLFFDLRNDEWVELEKHKDVNKKSKTLGNLIKKTGNNNNTSTNTTTNHNSSQQSNVNNHITSIGNNEASSQNKSLIINQSLSMKYFPSSKSLKKSLSLKSPYNYMNIQGKLGLRFKDISFSETPRS